MFWGHFLDDHVNFIVPIVFWYGPGVVFIIQKIYLEYQVVLNETLYIYTYHFNFYYP